MLDHKIFQTVMDAKTSGNIRDLIQLMEENYDIGWKPVGGRENNHATIDMGTDPAAGLVERITNAIDAVLQREWLERGRPTNLRSPREAVEQWFGIPGGRLGNIPEVRSSEITELAGRVCVTLYDSGHDDDRPTIDIRDRGCGIKAEDFSSTILSLNEGNKVRQFHLMGAFGQGGSTSLAYPDYTLIVSRALPSPDDRRTPPVAFTVVRFNPRDPATEKHGVYEYLVDWRTGHPFMLEVPEEAFVTGTLVRLVTMPLPKYHRLMTAPTNSLWYLAHHYLFDPVLPFRIEERRSNTSEGENRHVYGNVRRLKSGKDIEYERSAVLSFRNGKVTITWWVLSATGNKPQEKIRNYTLASQPVIITFNGQKQGELSNTLIKNQLRLPYLDRYLIVHVDCDQLDHESRRKLFPTTRESLRETPLRDALEQLVVDTLDGDQELKRLNEVRKAQYVQREESDVMNALRQRLANRVHAYVTTGAEGPGPRRPEPEGPPSLNKPVPIPVVDPPTFLEIMSKKPRIVYAGRRFAIRFRTDADPRYFQDRDAFMAIITPPRIAKFSGVSTVRDGYGVAYFTVDDDAAIGEQADITLELRPPAAKTLTDGISIQVAALPSGSGGGQGSAKAPDITPQWVYKNQPFWRDRGWDENSVATVVEEGNGAYVIYVSAENKFLVQRIERAQRHGTEAVDAIRAYYMEHIAFHAFLTYLAPQTERPDGADGGSETTLDSALLEREREQELQRACQTVLGMLDQVFNLIITERAAAAAVESR